MNDDQRRILESAGWPPELLDKLCESDAPHPANAFFRDHAESALTLIGADAIQFCMEYPIVSLVELTMRLARASKRKVSPIGLAFAIYHAAKRQGLVRTVAKDLLIRTVYEQFPSGWTTRDGIGPRIKLAQWEMGLIQGCAEQQLNDIATCIVDRFVTQPPPDGWLPLQLDDPTIESVFHECWPDDG